MTSASERESHQNHTYLRQQYEVPYPQIAKDGEVTVIVERRFELTLEQARQFGEALGQGWLIEMGVRVLEHSGINFVSFTQEPYAVIEAIEAGLVTEDGEEFSLREEMTKSGLGELYGPFISMLCAVGLAKLQRERPSEAEDTARAKRYEPGFVQQSENPSSTFMQAVRQNHPEWVRPIAAADMSRIAAFLFSNEHMSSVIGVQADQPEMKRTLLRQVITQPLERGLQTPFFTGATQLPLGELERVFSQVVAKYLPPSAQGEINWQTQVHGIDFALNRQDGGSNNIKNWRYPESYKVSQYARRFAMAIQSEPELCHQFIETLARLVNRRKLVVPVSSEVEIFELMFSTTLPDELFAHISRLGTSKDQNGNLPYYLEGRSEQGMAASIAMLWVMMGQETRLNVLKSFYSFYDLDQEIDGIKHN